MAITTTDIVKTRLKIADTTQDALIVQLIPKVEADYLNIRNFAYDLASDGVTITYPIGSDITAAEMIGYLLGKHYGYQTERIGSYSFSMEDATVSGYPKSIVGSITRFVSFI